MASEQPVESLLVAGPGPFDKVKRRLDFGGAIGRSVLGHGQKLPVVRHLTAKVSRPGVRIRAGCPDCPVRAFRQSSNSRTHRISVLERRAALNKEDT